MSEKVLDYVFCFISINGTNGYYRPVHSRHLLLSNFRGSVVNLEHDFSNRSSSISRKSSIVFTPQEESAEIVSIPLIVDGFGIDAEQTNEVKEIKGTVKAVVERNHDRVASAVAASRAVKVVTKHFGTVKH